MTADRHAALADQRLAVQGRVTALRQQQGAAVADGRAFDGGQIADLEQELRGFDAAEAELTRREGEANAARWRERRSELCGQLLGLADQRTAAVADAEAGARALVSGLRSVLHISQEMHKAAQEISGARHSPIPMAETKSQLSALLAAVLSDIDPPRHEFGNVKWHHTGLFKGHTDWVEHETKRLKAPLETLLKGLVNGKDRNHEGR